MAVGIIAEYNPFHNGHNYHLKKIKEKYKDEEIILILSGNFTQRGEPSIIDKWKKTEIALQAGIDLVVELPYFYATQSADYFSYGAISILEKLKVEKVIFGSETNKIDLLEELVEVELTNEEFIPLTKIYMKLGENYPTALSKALKDLTGKSIALPNDLLGISYIKVIKENHYQIKPECIKRKNNYHEKECKDQIASATSIRKALIEGNDISNNVPDFVLPYLTEIRKKEEYFPYLKLKIMQEENLEVYQTVDQSLKDKLKKEILEATSYENLIEKVKSKRYTHSKISRMLNHILCGFKKEEKENWKEIEYIRILGFSEKGQKYLNQRKKEIKVPIITNYSSIKSSLLTLELQATITYATPLEEEKKIELIKKEYQYHPKYKEKIKYEEN